MKRLIAIAALLLMVPALASGQNTEHPYRGQGYLFLGFGTGTGGGYLPVVKQLGFGGEGFLYKGLGVGAEAAYANWGGYYNEAWIGSGDISYHFRRHARAFRSIRLSLAASQLWAPPRWEGGVAHPQATSAVAPTCGWRSMPPCASRSETSSEPASGLSTTSSRFASA